MAGQRKPAEGRDRRRHQGKDCDLDEDGRTGGRSQPKQVVKLCGADPAAGPLAQATQQAVVLRAVGPPDRDQQHTHQVNPRKAGRPGRADHPICRNPNQPGTQLPGVAEDQDPVHGGVHQIRRDQCECDGTAMIRSLEIAAQREIQQQRQDAIGKAAQRRTGDREHGVIHRQVQQKRGTGGQQTHQQPRKNHGQHQPVQQPAVRLRHLLRAKSLRDECVQAEQHPAHSEAQRIEEYLGQRCRCHRQRGVGQVAQHDGIDQRHGHPSQLTCDQWQRESEQRRKLAANVGQAHPLDV